MNVPMDTYAQEDLEELLFLMESAETLSFRKHKVDKREILNSLGITEDWDILLEHLREACPVEEIDEDLF